MDYELGRVELLPDLWRPARRHQNTGTVDYLDDRGWWVNTGAGLNAQTFVPDQTIWDWDVTPLRNV